jgi:hypothetical protein
LGEISPKHFRIQHNINEFRKRAKADGRFAVYVVPGRGCLLPVTFLRGVPLRAARTPLAAVKKPRDPKSKGNGTSPGGRCREIVIFVQSTKPRILCGNSFS